MNQNETLPPPAGLPASLAEAIQSAIWELPDGEMATLAAHVDWPVEKVEAAISEDHV